MNDSPFARYVLALSIGILGLYWLVSGVRVAFSSGADTGPTGPNYSRARPETRGSQGLFMSTIGFACVCGAIYLVLSKGRD